MDSVLTLGRWYQNCINLPDPLLVWRIGKLTWKSGTHLVSEVGSEDTTQHPSLTASDSSQNRGRDFPSMVQPPQALQFPFFPNLPLVGVETHSLDKTLPTYSLPGQVWRKNLSTIRTKKLFWKCCII